MPIKTMAFQNNAFQNNAFQVEDGGYPATQFHRNGKSSKVLFDLRFWVKHGRYPTDGDYRKYV